MHEGAAPPSERTVSIGFTIRDHFSDAAGSVRSILRHTHRPFTLYVVDCGMPERYRREVEGVVAGRSDVRWIRSASFLFPNQSRNLVLTETKDDYVCFVENDNYVEEDWLEKLIAACETHGAGVAIPLLYDGPQWMGSLHFHHDRGNADIRIWEENGVVKRTVVSDPPLVRARAGWTAARRVNTLEMHVFLMRRDAIDAVGSFDERFLTGEEIDLAFSLHQQGVSVVLEPAVKVSYHPAVRLGDDERPFYFFRWDPERAVQSDTLVREKWNAVRTQNTAEFVRGQRHRVNRLAWFAYRARKVPGWLRIQLRLRTDVAGTNGDR